MVPSGPFNGMASVFVGEERGICIYHKAFCMCFSLDVSYANVELYVLYTVSFSLPMSLTDCKEGDILGQLAWIIPVSIVGGILLLGVLLLVVAKCILMVIVS